MWDRQSDRRKRPWRRYRCNYYIPCLIAMLVTLAALISTCGFDASPTSEIPGISPEQSTREVFAFPLTEDFFQGELSIEGRPVLMQPVKLRLSISPVADASNATIKLFLPDSVELIEGNREWVDNIKRGQTVCYDAVIKATQPGQSRVRLYVEASFANSHVESQNYFVFLLSSATRGEVSREPFDEEERPRQQQPTKGGQS